MLLGGDNQPPVYAQYGDRGPEISCVIGTWGPWTRVLYWIKIRRIECTVNTSRRRIFPYNGIQIYCAFQSASSVHADRIIQGGGLADILKIIWLVGWTSLTSLLLRLHVSIPMHRLQELYWGKQPTAALPADSLWRRPIFNTWGVDNAGAK